ncbi:MBL fold metallo-hydrolase [uncultured Eubacterium sp.]|uniref:MBL fold metallo-hydrolase n=1 Tax=uncultured Eubacterium sp. TaxID=165185 RepID=UPI000E8F2342|nr:MBL fold metallo-hydrolase [uncultured Eubacterium sp.]HAH18704.1 ribonuclease Z [Eubacterium sp.]HAV90368.1 ribonuclease Z [Eubacterium sp.]
MIFGSIASGSSGNCAFASSGNTNLLIDTGISKKRIEEGLSMNDISASEINGILITHEHIDHISGLGVFLRKYKDAKVYSTKKTIDAILNGNKIGKVEPESFIAINKDEEFEIGDLTVRAFAISHDAADPVGYRVMHESSSVAVATDMGYYDEYIIDNLKGINAGIIEANHDVNMLMVGSYPYELKRRILGTKGHLSNESSGKLIDSILHDDLEYILLGHLSKENNMEELAFESVKNEINLSESPYNTKDFNIRVAKRDEPMRFMEI